MVKLSQALLITNDDFMKQEMYCHKNAYEHIPFARAVDYATLSKGSPCILLTVQTFGGSDAEEEIIENYSWRKYIALISRAVLNKSDDFSYELLSLSFNEELNKSKTEGLAAKLLLKINKEEKLSDETMKILAENINNAITGDIVPIHNTATYNKTSANTESVSNNESDVINIPELPNDFFGKNDKIILDNQTDNIEKSNDKVKDFFNNIYEDIEPKKIEPVASNNSLNNNFFNDLFDFGNDNSAMSSSEANAFSEDELTSMNDSFFNIEEDDDTSDNDIIIEEDNTITDKKENIVDTYDTPDIYEDNNMGSDEPLSIEKIEDDNISPTLEEIEPKNSETKIESVINEKEETFIPLLNSDNYEYTLNLEYEEDPIVTIHDIDHDVKTTSSSEKLKRVYEKVYKYYINNEKNYTRRAVQGEVSAQDFINNIRAYIEKYEKIPIEDIDYVVDKIKRALFSYHVLIAVINDPTISDIRITSASNIIVKIKGKHYKVDGLKFIDDEDYFNFIRNIIIRNRVMVSKEIIHFTDINFCEDYILRFNICLSNVNTPGVPYVHIGKVPKDKITLKKLIESETLDERIAAYLIDKAKTSKGIIFSGASRSGKTTLMNALIDYIPKGESINCMQESDEMYTNIHPNAYMQHIVRDNDGKEKIGLSELGQNSLVCDAQYFIIGEVKGAEARDMLRASNTGHKCWCSVHSPSSKETIPRLADYVKLGSDYSLQEAERMLKDFEVIVYLENYKVREITEIKGYDEENKSIIYKTVYTKGINGR